MSNHESLPRRAGSSLLALALAAGAALGAAPTMAQNNAGDPAKTPVIHFSAPPVAGFDKYEWTFRVEDYAGDRPPWYWAQQNAFQSTGTYYWGLQVAGPYGLTALYSFFGAETHSSYLYCETGADGGSGTTCRIPYKWIEGRDYKFTATLEGEYPSRSKQIWSGTITDLTTGVTTVIGVVAVPRSWGLVRPGNIAWAEWFWGGEKTCEQRSYFRALYDAPVGYLDGIPYQETITKTNPDTCASYTSLSPTRMRMEAGGTR